MDDLKYAYLIADLVVGLPVWLFLYARRKDLRKEILVVSFLMGLFGLFGELWFHSDYWRPEIFTGYAIGVEDFLFAFFLGGIGTAGYEEFTGQHHKRIRKKMGWFWPIFILFAISVVSFNGLYLLGLNSIAASSISFLIFTLFVLYFRRDLIFRSIASGLMLAGVMAFAYFVILKMFPNLILAWWYLDNLSGILIFGVPIEEFYWAFTIGTALGVFYHFLRGLKGKPLWFLNID